MSGFQMTLIISMAVIVAPTYVDSVMIPDVYRRVVVTFFQRSDAEARYTIENATVVKQYGRRLVLSLFSETPDASVVSDIGEYLVESIESDSILSLADTPQQNQSWFQWNLADSERYGMHVQGVWAQTNSSPNVIVAVLDTGLAAPAFPAFLHVAQGFDFVSDLSISVDGDGRDQDPTDPGDAGPDCPYSSWHGTKVASILAARHDIFPTAIRGVAQNATIIPIRVLGVCGEGYANDITDAIVWAAGGTINGVTPNSYPAKIISMSLAGSGLCPSYLQSAINQAINLGAIIVTAAGNDGLPDVNSTFPANCIGVISVGAETRDGTLASYSNKQANIIAPGGDSMNPITVLSISAQGLLQLSRSMGTSMATPHVAGAAALMAASNNVSGLTITNLSRDTLLQLFNRHFPTKNSIVNSSVGEAVYKWTTSRLDMSQNVRVADIGGCSYYADLSYIECTCQSNYYAVFSGCTDCYPWSTGMGCKPCPPNTWTFGDGMTLVGPTCNLCRTCSSTQFQVYSCGIGYNTGCRTCTKCKAGSTYEKKLCSSTTDTVCSNCKACVSGFTYETQPCNGVTDRVCSSCTACDSTSQYQTQACAVTQNRACGDCTICNPLTQYETRACSGTNDRLCGNCSAACNVGSTFESKSCNGKVNRVCTACKKCSKSEYVNKTCTISSDTVCSPCKTPIANNQYYAGNVSLNNVLLCPILNCTNALPNQYYSGNPTLNGPTGCPVANCTNKLPIGRYWSKDGGASPTGCISSPCAVKPPNSEFYNSTTGTSNTTASCPYGCNAGYYRNASQLCPPCGPYTFSASLDSRNCTRCLVPLENAVYTPQVASVACVWECNIGFVRDPTPGSTICMSKEVVVQISSTALTMITATDMTTTRPPLVIASTTTTPQAYNPTTTTTSQAYNPTTTTKSQAYNLTTTSSPLITAVTTTILHAYTTATTSPLLISAVTTTMSPLTTMATTTMSPLTTMATATMSSLTTMATTTKSPLTTMATTTTKSPLTTMATTTKSQLTTMATTTKSQLTTMATTSRSYTSTTNTYNTYSATATTSPAFTITKQVTTTSGSTAKQVTTTSGSIAKTPVVFFEIVISEPVGTQVNLTKYRQVTSQLLGITLDTVMVSHTSINQVPTSGTQDVFLLVTINIISWSQASSIAAKCTSNAYQTNLNIACQSQGLPSAQVLINTVGFANIPPDATASTTTTPKVIKIDSGVNSRYGTQIYHIQNPWALVLTMLHTMHTLMLLY